MVTGMVWVTGNDGLWKQAWRWASTDDGDRQTTGMHEAVDDGDGHEGRSGSAEVFPQEPTQVHGRWLTTADTVQASTLSLPEYVQFTRPMHSFLYPETRAPTRAQHKLYPYNKCRSQRCHLLWSKGTWRGVTFTNDVSRNQRSVRKG